MPPPPDTFVKLCASAKIALPAAKDRAKFLVDAGTPPPSGTSSRDISERTAALVWSLASLARKEDPSSWTTSLPAALHPTLLALYPLPPWRGPGAAPPDFARLATILELYAPDGAPQAAGALQGAGASSIAQPPPSGSDGININRPPDGDGGSSSSSGSGASPAPPLRPSRWRLRRPHRSSASSTMTSSSCCTPTFTTPSTPPPACRRRSGPSSRTPAGAPR
jgi:hypothetical protein